MSPLFKPGGFLDVKPPKPQKHFRKQVVGFNLFSKIGHKTSGKGS